MIISDKNTKSSLFFPTNQYDCSPRNSEYEGLRGDGGGGELVGGGAVMKKVVLNLVEGTGGRVGYQGIERARGEMERWDGGRR